MKFNSVEHHSNEADGTGRIHGFAPLSRRGFLGGVAGVGVLSLLGGCSNGAGGTGSTGAASDESSGSILAYYISNPTAIDPYNCQETMGSQVVSQLFDGLMIYDFQNDELVCTACESYEMNDDATVFTFHLREGMTFHNGDTVDAQSFKRAFERIVDPSTNDSPSAISYHLEPVQGYDELLSGDADELSGVTCPDELTLVISLKYSYADFPYVLTHPALVPVPQAALDDPASYLLAPIGNGPFQMEGQWEDGQMISVRKFDDYYGTPSSIDGVDFSIRRDVGSAYMEFQAGTLDFCQVPNAQYEDATQQYGISNDGYTATPGNQVLNGSELSTYYLIINNTQPPFDDVNLRRAVSLAINREAICETVFNGNRTPADGFVAPMVDGYQEGSWEYCKYDPDQAREILDQYYPADADGNRGITLQLSYDLNGDHADIMDVVMSSLNEVGIQVTADTGEWANIVARVHDLDYQFCRMGWSADYPTLDNFLYPLFCSSSPDDASGYKNDEVDAAIAEARATVDHDERIAKFQAVDKMIGEDCPVVPLFYYQHNYVVAERVDELYLSPGIIPSLDAVKMG
ncbi:ABC transporter substrate-binding protein [Collinsella sp. An2]|uniref:ABC transporter substrate-binding protein n=1 Tax=Collinsella sp. An2 TaxID=1965585 RepID=UPI000B388FAC|nr:ABC transporter substrate-binding protein [Collinsella sp. An2]OUP10949.1 hypothetical protein B5F33_00755 [Collinsella sp. An2]